VEITSAQSQNGVNHIAFRHFCRGTEIHNSLRFMHMDRFSWFAKTPLRGAGSIFPMEHQLGHSALAVSMNFDKAIEMEGDW
jgi:hypothetical protein